MLKDITFEQFLRKFPTEDSCIEYLKDLRWPDGIYCETCWKVTKHYKLTNRRSYICKECRHHTSPTSSTIFHKSWIPLQLWFMAIFLITKSRNGVSAKEIQRVLGISYGGAWRMCKLIRTVMADQEDQLLTGIVEADETFIGGKGFNRGKVWWQNWDERPKQIIFGMIERNGRVKTAHIPNTGVRTLLNQIQKNIDKKAHLMTDNYHGYWNIYKSGYTHDLINHSKHYVDGNIYTQNIEGFWSILKAGLKGTYRGAVSSKYLELYTKEFTFRHNHKNEDMFNLILKLA